MFFPSPPTAVSRGSIGSRSPGDSPGMPTTRACSSPPTCGSGADHRTRGGDAEADCDWSVPDGGRRLGQMTRLRRSLVALGLLVFGLGAFPAVASAHAQLESSNPGQSAVLLVPPTQVVLHFGEPVEIDFGSLRVIGPAGERVDAGAAHHPGGDTHSVATALPSDLADGTYVVAWRVISADSHPGARRLRVLGRHGQGLDPGRRPGRADREHVGAVHRGG